MTRESVGEKEPVMASETTTGSNIDIVGFKANRRGQGRVIRIAVVGRQSRRRSRCNRRGTDQLRRPRLQDRSGAEVDVAS
jgi:hypothetical protein